MSHSIESYPAAESYARRMKLPLTSCSTTRDLYKHNHVVLDVSEARAQLAEAGFHRSSGGGQAAQDAAIAILEERVENLRNRQ